MDILNANDGRALGNTVFQLPHLRDSELWKSKDDERCSQRTIDQRKIPQRQLKNPHGKCHSGIKGVKEGYIHVSNVIFLTEAKLTIKVNI